MNILNILKKRETITDTRTETQITEDRTIITDEDLRHTIREEISELDSRVSMLELQVDLMKRTT